MKSILASVLAALLAFAASMVSHAQTAEGIWLGASTSAYHAGETVIITVNGQSATAIQGFTFQIRYDPACLKPVNAASPISGMNGLSLPQTSGLVDASFASTTPQTVSGVLAEVRFLSVATCQTSVVLESAALAIRNSSGYAMPLSGIAIGNRNLTLNIGPGTGAAGTVPPLIGTPMPLGVASPSSSNLWLWGGIILLVMALAGGGLLKLLQWSRKDSSAP